MVRRFRAAGHATRRDRTAQRRNEQSAVRSGTREHFLTSATEPVGGMPEDLAKAARADFEKYGQFN